VGNWNTPPVEKIENNKKVTCYTRCGQEELFRRACPVVQWAIRAGVKSSDPILPRPADHYRAQSATVFFNSSKTCVDGSCSNKITGKEAPYVAWGITSTYNWKLTGRQGISNDEFTLSASIDVSDVDFGRDERYYFSLVPLCNLIVEPKQGNGTYTPGDGTVENPPTFTETHLVYPHIYTSNVAWTPEKSGAIGPVVPEGESIYFGKMYNAANHEAYKTCKVSDVIQEAGISDRFGANRNPVDRWSVGVNMLWVPQTAVDCEDCFTLVDGVGVCTYLSTPTQEKFLNKGDCLAFVAN
jgi:hypothetical protein